MDLAQIWRRAGERTQAFFARARARRDEPTTLQGGLRARFHRYLRMAGGFALSVLLLGGAALYINAASSRVTFAPEPVLAAPQGGSQALAAAEYIFQWRQRSTGLAADRMFAPPSLRRREADAYAAAEDVAQSFIAQLQARRGARDALWSEAQDAGPKGGAQAGDAIDRLNAGVARRQIVLEASPQSLRALAAEAAAACAARASEVNEQLQRRESGQRGDEAVFFAARGEAYAWLLLLRAANADLGESGLGDDPAFARTLAALTQAAGYDPVLFFAGPRGGAFAPNHLAVVGFDLAIAAQEARALAEG